MLGSSLLRAGGLLLLLCALLPSAAFAAAPGVNVGTVSPSAETVATVADLGARWQRTFADWSSAEPSRGAYDAAYMGALSSAVDRMRSRNVGTLLVVTGAPAWASGSGGGIAPPRDPADYARFVGELARRNAGKGVAYEIWNEEDGADFWLGGPDPAAYARLLKAAYPAVKAADPQATVVLGGLVGNDFDFLEALYGQGAQGSFDAVGVHTDTACGIVSPDNYYREPSGRIGRYSFSGYREVRETMLAHGDDKPIWMTELGWSTTTTICATGAYKGQKAGGVSEEEQARFLSQAYHCLEADPYVQVGLWFTLQDLADGTASSHQYGLMRSNGTHKPSFDAFRRYAREGDGLSGACGGRIDKVAPIVKVETPTAGATFSDHLEISASATDDQGVRRLTFLADGRTIRNFSGGSGTIDWQRADSLGLGTHTITVQAVDEARNVGTASVAVTRIDPRKLPPIATRTALGLGRRRGRVHTVSGRVSAGATALRIGGKVHVIWQRWDERRRRWVTAQKYSRNAGRAFTFPVRLGQRGRWRVHAEYAGARPFRGSRSSFVYVSAP